MPLAPTLATVVTAAAISLLVPAPAYADGGVTDFVRTGDAVEWAKDLAAGPCWYIGIDNTPFPSDPEVVVCKPPAPDGTTTG